MRVYVTKDHEDIYRISIREPNKSYKELDVPKNAAYLLLAAQSSTDALQDTLESMYGRSGDHTLSWTHTVPPEDQWENNAGGQSNAW